MTFPSLQSLIPFEEIDFDDTTYKISKPHVSEQLTQSIKKYGVIEQPILVSENNRFIILSGHNRLSAAKALGKNRQMCIILESFNLNVFLQIALKKLYHSEIGPLGKIKLYRILKNHEPVTITDSADFAIKELGIPEYILSSEDIVNKALSFPPFLAKYLEMKEPGFKTIRDIIRLSENIIATLSNWLEAVPMRANVFRQVIDLLYDIDRKAKHIDYLQHIQIPFEGDTRYKEASILRSLMAICYPNFSERRRAADLFLSTLRNNGVQTHFPEFFEGDEVLFTINVSKREGCAAFFNKIDKIDKETIEKLLELL